MSHYHLKLLKSNQNKTLRSQQRLTPLFILAFSLVGFGAYKSYHSFISGQNASYYEPVKRPPSIEASTLDAISAGMLSREESSEGMNLYYRDGGLQRFDMQMRQQNEYAGVGAGKRKIETVLNLAWHDEVVRAQIQEHLEIERSFGRVQIEVMEQGKPIGGDITHQLGILISGTGARITMSDRGLIKSQEWVSEKNARTAQTLHLIDDVFRLMYPHFLREAVHVGEEWTYWLRTTAEDVSPERLEADGALEVSNRIEGIIKKDNRQYAVIVQKITGSLRGAFNGVNSYTVHGNGQGLVLFDVEAGELYSSHIELERTIRLDDERAVGDLDTAPAQISRIELYLIQQDNDQAAIE